MVLLQPNLIDVWRAQNGQRFTLRLIRPADWLLPPKPEEDARPPAPKPDAAPFTKEELIDGIADCIAALLAQRDEKIAELGGKLDAVLQILGTGKSDDIIIDLPKNFWRRDAA